MLKKYACKKKNSPSTSAAHDTLSLYDLPANTPDLQVKLSEIGILGAQTAFMKHWGSFLFLKTGGEPSPTQYTTFANTICAQYPILKGGIRNDCVRNFKDT